MRRRRSTRRETKAFMRGHNAGWYGSIAFGQHSGLPNEMRGRNLSKVDLPGELTFRERRLRRKLDRLTQKAHSMGVVQFPGENVESVAASDPGEPEV